MPCVTAWKPRGHATNHRVQWYKHLHFDLGWTIMDEKWRLV